MTAWLWSGCLTLLCDHVVTHTELVLWDLFKRVINCFMLREKCQVTVCVLHCDLCLSGWRYLEKF